MTWELSLFDDEPKLYGPKPLHREGEVGTTSKAAGSGVGRTQADADRWARNLAVRTINPLGAPPLDWWVIDG